VNNPILHEDLEKHSLYDDLVRDLHDEILENPEPFYAILGRFLNELSGLR